eukprot:1187744-Prorocentrum_minimum.AAC.8
MLSTSDKCRLSNGRRRLFWRCGLRGLHQSLFCQPILTLADTPPAPLPRLGVGARAAGAQRGDGTLTSQRCPRKPRS